MQKENLYGEITRIQFLELLIDLLDDERLPPPDPKFIKFLTRKGKRLSHFNEPTISAMIHISSDHHEKYLKLIFHHNKSKIPPSVSSFFPQLLDMVNEKLG